MRASILLLILSLTGCGAAEAADTKTSSTRLFSTTSIPSYVRSEWGRWIDVDKDCQDTRQEVLIVESHVPVIYEDDRQCRVLSGLWKDPYTGEEFTDPSDLDIDHVISLKEAHEAGGWNWSSERKKEFVNDLLLPESLVASSASANRSKGSRGPTDWMPSAEEYRCAYLKARVKIFHKWKLYYSSEQYLNLMIKHCR